MANLSSPQILYLVKSVWKRKTHKITAAWKKLLKAGAIVTTPLFCVTYKWAMVSLSSPQILA
jgi:hypothetical protein